MSGIDKIIELFRERGHSEYGGEAVTQLQHALQCAALAEAEDADSCLIVAALLHDVGHLVHTLPNDAPEQGVDDLHEALGQRYLRRMFDERVTEPVAMHVAAKRYLCAIDFEYQRQLSQPSLTSLHLQGGPMSQAEICEFEANPFHADAVRLRRWDDLAKVPDLETPTIEHFRSHLQAAAAAKGTAE